MDIKIKVNRIHTISPKAINVIILLAVSSCLIVPNNALIQKAIFVIGAIYSLYYFNINRCSVLGNELVWCIKKICMPYALMFIYTFLLVQQNNEYNLDIAEQAFTTTVFMIIQILFASGIICCFKDKAISVTYKYVVLSYVLTIIIAFNKQGFIGVIKNYGTLDSLIESHDIGVAVVSILMHVLYGILYKHKSVRQNLKQIICLLTVLFMCGKRSAILAFVVGFVMLCFFSYNIKNRKQIALLASTGVILTLYLYVVIIQSGLFYKLTTELGINASGRAYVWNWFNDQYNITPLYMGKGFQYIHKYMEAQIANNGVGYSMVSAYGYLHNSVLQLFIELGFFSFFSFFIYYLIYIPIKLEKRFNQEIFYLYLSLIIMATVTYLTDNTLTYPVFKSTTYIVIFYEIMQTLKKDTIKQERGSGVQHGADKNI